MNTQEAYVKALGRGFSGAPFKHFAIQFQAGGATEESTDPDSDVYDMIYGCRISLFIDISFIITTPSRFFFLHLQEIKLGIQPSADPELLTTDWQFALFELASSHHVAICVKKSGEMNDPKALFDLFIYLLRFSICSCGWRPSQVEGLEGHPLRLWRACLGNRPSPDH